MAVRSRNLPFSTYILYSPLSVLDQMDGAPHPTRLRVNQSIHNPMATNHAARTSGYFLHDI